MQESWEPLSRFPARKLGSIRYIRESGRYLGFAGTFGVRYELACTPCHIHYVEFSRGFRTRVFFPSTELYVSRLSARQMDDSMAPGRGLDIGSAISFRSDHRKSTKIYHHMHKIQMDVLHLENRASIQSWCRYVSERGAKPIMARIIVR